LRKEYGNMDKIYLYTFYRVIILIITQDYYGTTNVRILLMCPYVTKTPILGNIQFLDFINGATWLEDMMDTKQKYL